MKDIYVLYTLMTSGPELKKDRVIEIAAALFENGELNSQQHWRVGLSSLVPASQDQKGKEDPGKKMLEDFINYCADRPLVVCRKSDDVFLRHNLRRVLKQKLTVDVLNITELAAVVLPELWRHEFESLLKHYGMPEQEQMTAPVRLGLMGQVWGRVLLEAKGLDAVLLKKINTLLGPTEWKYKGFFAGLEQRKTPRRASQKDGKQVGPRPINDGGVSFKSTAFSIDPPKLTALFAPEGVLSGNFPGCDVRPGPVDAALKVHSTLKEDKLLFAEMPGGIGKTLSYLVPAVYHALSTGERVVVASGARNLQDGLYRKDIPDLKAALGIDFGASLVKGWAGYLCLLRWNELLEEGKLKEEERIALVYTLIWLERTVTGNLDESRVGPDYYEIFRSLSGRMSIDGKTCTGRECHWYDDCFVMKAKDDIDASHLIITNHYALLTELVSDRNMLGDSKHLIIDEAHNLESSAIAGLGADFGQEKIEGVIYRAEAGGLLTRLEEIFGLDGFADLDEGKKGSLGSHRHELKGVCERARSVGEEFFARVADLIKGEDQLKSFGKLRLNRGDIEAASESGDGLIDVLEDLSARLENLRDDLKPALETSLPLPLEGRMSELRSIASVLSREVASLADQARFLLAMEEDGYVYWAQARGGGLHLHGAPIDLGGDLGETVYGRFKSVVLTSDTFGVDRRLDYAAERLGGDSLQDRLDKTVIASSFDYNKGLLLCVPSYLSEPNKESFMEEVSRLAVTVSKLVNGRSMFIFTSYSMLNSVHHSIKPNLVDEGIEVLGQGLDGSRRSIARRFMEAPRSILLCTEGFWEGMEVPGDGLKCLIMAKLPFPVPSEPTVAGRMESLQNRGFNPFESFMVPQAEIRFRVGLRGLIQGRKEKGVVVVADRRIISTTYGRRFLGALPVENPLSCKHEGELIGWIREWLKDLS